MFKQLALPKYDDLMKARMSAPPKSYVPTAGGFASVMASGYEQSEEAIVALEKQINDAETELNSAIVEGFSVITQYVAYDKSIMLLLHRPD